MLGAIDLKFLILSTNSLVTVVEMIQGKCLREALLLI